MEDMFAIKMKSFWETASKQHEELVKNFEKAQKDLFELGNYLGQKNDKEYEYLGHLLAFSQSVDKVIQDINKQEREEEKKRKKEEAKRKKKEEAEKRKKLRAEKAAKKGENKGKKRKGNNKLRGLANDALKDEDNAAITLENKLDALFSGDIKLPSMKDVTKKKTDKKRTHKHDKKDKNKDKMNKKLSNQEPNFAEDMLALLSIENINQRRKSRFIDNNNNNKNVNDNNKKSKDMRNKTRLSPPTGTGLIDISELAEPSFGRQQTAFKITKEKSKKHHKKEKRKRRKKKRQESLKKLSGLLGF